MGGRLVVVDDSAEYRAQILALLVEEGYEVVGVAPDGRTAVAVVVRTGPDAVLLDIQLPDASGFDVAPEIEHAAPNTRIILISSREAADYGDRLVRAGVPFIAKNDVSAVSLAAAIGMDR